MMLCGGVIFPALVAMGVFLRQYEIQAKRLVEDLVMTPESKRDKKLKWFCEKYEVQYLEVEDDKA